MSNRGNLSAVVQQRTYYMCPYIMLQHTYFDIVLVFHIINGIGHWGEILKECRLFLLFGLQICLFCVSLTSLLAQITDDWPVTHGFETSLAPPRLLQNRDNIQIKWDAEDYFMNEVEVSTSEMSVIIIVQEMHVH